MGGGGRMRPTLPKQQPLYVRNKSVASWLCQPLKSSTPRKLKELWSLQRNRLPGAWIWCCTCCLEHARNCKPRTATWKGSHHEEKSFLIYAFQHQCWYKTALQIKTLSLFFNDPFFFFLQRRWGDSKYLDTTSYFSRDTHILPHHKVKSASWIGNWCRFCWVGPYPLQQNAPN